MAKQRIPRVDLSLWAHEPELQPEPPPIHLWSYSARTDGHGEWIIEGTISALIRDECDRRGIA